MITRGTTPTIEFTFKNISPKDMKVAYLTIDQNGRTKIEKNIDDAIVTVSGFTASGGDDITGAAAGQVWEFSVFPHNSGSSIIWKNWSA